MNFNLKDFLIYFFEFLLLLDIFKSVIIFSTYYNFKKKIKTQENSKNGIPILDIKINDYMLISLLSLFLSGYFLYHHKINSIGIELSFLYYIFHIYIFNKKIIDNYIKILKYNKENKNDNI